MHMDVIFTDHSFQYLHILCIANLYDYLPATLLYITSQYRIPVFRYPHEVRRKPGNRMSASPLLSHVPKVITDV